MHQLQVEEEYGLTRELLLPCAVLAPVLGKPVQVHVHPVLGQVQLLVEHHVALLTQEDRQVKVVDGHMLLLEWGEGCYLNACTSHLYQTLVLPNLAKPRL